MTIKKSMFILISGPYRSGTNGDPVAMAANLARMEEAAWPIFAAGHLPIIGEWVALPVLRSGGIEVADPRAGKVLYPAAERILERCDAVLRIPGDSFGADHDVDIATRRGLPVFYSVSEIPVLGEVIA